MAAADYDGCAAGLQKGIPDRAAALALYAVTLAWMISVFKKPLLWRIAWWAGTLGALSSVLEVGIITVQVVRGTPSHFNVSTSFDRTMYILMALGVVFLYGAALAIGALLLFSHRIQDRSLIWALRLGLSMGVAGLSVGFLMLSPPRRRWPTPATGARGVGHRAPGTVRPGGPGRARLPGTGAAHRRTRPSRPRGSWP